MGKVNPLFPVYTIVYMVSICGKTLTHQSTVTYTVCGIKDRDGVSKIQKSIFLSYTYHKLKRKNGEYLEEGPEKNVYFKWSILSDQGTEQGYFIVIQLSHYTPLPMPCGLIKVHHVCYVGGYLQ